MDQLSRLASAVNYLKSKDGLTNESISLSIGYRSKNYLSDLLGGNKPISKLFLEKLEKTFRVSADYVETGEGDMIIKSNYRFDDENTIYTAAEKSIRRPKVNSSPYLVPFVDIPAQAGYTKAYSNIDYIETLKHYPILPDVDPTGGVWRYFQVEGDSMEEEIKAGDTLLASLVLREDWPDVKDYYTYVVVTDEDLLIKDIYKESDSTWLLLSQNDHYKPKRIKIEDVRQLWVLRRHIRNRVKKSRMYDMKTILTDMKTKK